VKRTKKSQRLEKKGMHKRERHHIMGGLLIDTQGNITYALIYKMKLYYLGEKELESPTSIEKEMNNERGE